MKRTIVNPHWVNNARTVISAEFHYDDGRVAQATISESDVTNPDLVEIKSKFTDEQLEANTRKKIQEINAERERKHQEELAKAQRKQQEELFAAKLRIFEIDTIKESSNRALKAKIRKSKSDVEALAWASALLLDAAQKETTTNPTTE
jgi:RNase P/RNase MRP subunit p30